MAGGSKWCTEKHQKPHILQLPREDVGGNPASSSEPPLLPRQLLPQQERPREQPENRATTILPYHVGEIFAALWP